MNEHIPSTTAIGDPVVQQLLEREGEADDVAISWHARDALPHLDADMHSLYGNIHSTLANLRIYGGLDRLTDVYVARRRQQTVAIFLVCLDGKSLHVINEGMTVDEAELNRFAAEAFSRWPSVTTISMHAVRGAIGRLRYPFQQYPCTAEIVLPLPVTADEYVAGLGKNMRRNLRRYMDKLKRNFPSFRYDVYEKDAVQEQHVRDIIALNRVRIAGKNMRYGLDDEVEKVVALARECGMVGVMTVDGRVIGGGVGYLVGDSYYFKVISHDPQYNDYSPGILCCYLTISQCIARGCKEFNFMWNEFEYKFALGAAPRNLLHLVVYRSRLQFLLNAPLVVRNAIAAFRHQASMLLGKTRTETLTPRERFARQVLVGMRAVKRVVVGGK